MGLDRCQGSVGALAQLGHIHGTGGPGGEKGPTLVEELIFVRPCGAWPKPCSSHSTTDQKVPLTINVHHTALLIRISDGDRRELTLLKISQLAVETDLFICL